MRKYLQLISQRANLPIQRAPKYSKEKDPKVIYVKKNSQGYNQALHRNGSINDLRI